MTVTFPMFAGMDLGRINEQNRQLMHLLMVYFKLRIVNHKLLELFVPH